MGNDVLSVVTWEMDGRVKPVAKHVYDGNPGWSTSNGQCVFTAMARRTHPPPQRTKNVEFSRPEIHQFSGDLRWVRACEKQVSTNALTFLMFFFGCVRSAFSCGRAPSSSTAYTNSIEQDEEHNDGSNLEPGDEHRAIETSMRRPGIGLHCCQYA